MKRIKIMLLSFALLAVVGGALAFKAKFSTFYCYTTTTIATTACAPQSVGFQNDPAKNIVYYTTAAVQWAPGDLRCYKSINGNPNNTTDLTCTTETPLTLD